MLWEGFPGGLCSDWLPFTPQLQLLPMGRWAGRLHGGHVFSYAPCRRGSNLIIYQCWQLFKWSKQNVQTWNHRASVHRLLQKQLAGSSQELTVPHDSRFAVLVIQLNTDPFNAWLAYGRNHVWHFLSAHFWNWDSLLISKCISTRASPPQFYRCFCSFTFLQLRCLIIQI